MRKLPFSPRYIFVISLLSAFVFTFNLLGNFDVVTTVTAEKQEPSGNSAGNNFTPQTTVFNDDFSSGTDAAYSTGGPIGSSTFSVTRSGADWGARRNSSPQQLELTNDVGSALNVNGWIFASTTTTSFSAPYNPILTNNNDIISWTFNMRQVRADPSGFGSSADYGVAFVLASNTNTPTIGAGKAGYAVVLGEFGVLDPIRLIHFSSGLQSTQTRLITSGTAGLSDFGAEFLSVRVTYDPTTEQWELFLRNDGTAGFSDPATGTLISQGTATNSTSTGVSLGFMGAYWQGSTAASQTAFFDNVKVNVGATTSPGTIQLSAASYSGGENGGPISLTLSRTGGSSGAVSVDIAYSGGSATGGTICGGSTDYINTSGTVNWPDGDATDKQVLVGLCNDTVYEGNETFIATLSSPTGGAAIGAQASSTVTITNDDPTPTISINDVAMTEGNSGTMNMTFTISLSGASGQSASVNWSTSNGTATVADGDYSAASASAIIPAGSTSTTVNVTVNGDTKFEANETLFVNLSSPLNATIDDGQGQGTINNDDAAPTLSINDVTQAEGNSGASSFAFTVTLSAASGVTATVNYATSNVTATAGTDYTAANGSLTFNPGETSKQVSVTASGDTTFEANETFNLTLSSQMNASIGDGIGVGTINNDDSAPTISVSDVSQAEENAGTSMFAFTISLSEASGIDTTVAFATADSTATMSDSDYHAASGTATIAAGASNTVVNVTVNGDSKFEPNETFMVNLSGGSGYTPAGSDLQAVGTITNDDAMPSLSIDDVSMIEGNSGTSNLVFTATLSAASGASASVNWATADGTATAGSDYTSAAGTLTIPANSLSGTISVSVNGDTAFEPSETFFVSLSSPANVIVNDGQGQGTIQNDDADAVAFVVNTTVDETDGSCSDGDCSLRDAVALANSSPGADTIEFNFGALGVPSQITLGGTQISITSDLTITGPGANLLSISGNDLSRVFSIGPAITVNISGITITNGSETSGGGVLVNPGSTVAIDSSSISGNRIVSAFPNHGGGIYNNQAALTISNSTISGNRNDIVTGNGGGIYNFRGIVTLVNTTISGNFTSFEGGGIYNVGDVNGAAQLSVKGCTFYFNEADEGKSIRNSGAVGQVSLEIGNTILTGDGTAFNLLAAAGTVTSLGYNLSSDNGSNHLTGTGDILNTDPLLGPLADNGGPTLTHALLNGSPAIDKGSWFGLTTDQRGYMRPLDIPWIPNGADGDGADIGAFEELLPTAATVSLSGRIATQSGMGIRGAQVTIIGGDLPGPMVVQTGSFGYYSFEGLAAGETYIVSVSAKRYVLEQPVRVVTLTDDVAGFDFVAQPRE